MNSVKIVSKSGLCSACGVCSAVCPKNAITFTKEKTYIATVNEKCIDCGICLGICTATDVEIRNLYAKNGQPIPENLLVGNAIKSYNVALKDKSMLLNSTSGGFVSGVIKELLEKKLYDSAFVVKGYSYDSMLKSEKITEYTPNIAKSRYLSVSMENLIQEMLSNKDEKIIICATPCAVQGILNVIEKYHLVRDNYLVLGLFCDNTQSYELNEYFSTFNKSKITALYFRDKLSGSWPGDLKIVYDNGREKFYSASKRKDAKKYYKLKRCFTCFDKLNALADISVGDNYTKENTNAKGSNSIIIRTQKGLDTFESIKKLFEIYEVELEKIIKAQSIEEREKNLVNASIISELEGITIYKDTPVEYSEKDKSRLLRELDDTKKDIPQIKREIKKKEKERFIKTIKRKLQIR